MAESYELFRDYMISTVDNTVTSSGNSGALDSRNFGQANVTLSVNSISGTNPSIQFTLQVSDDNINWQSIHDTKRFTTTGFQNFNAIKIATKYYRFKWIVAGTSPSITFTITTTLKPFTSISTHSMLKYADLILNNTNNVSTVFFSNSNEIVSVALHRSSDGLGLAAIILQGSADGEKFSTIAGPVDIATGDNIIRNFSSVGFKYFRIKVSTASSGSPTLDIFWASTGGS